MWLQWLLWLPIYEKPCGARVLSLPWGSHYRKSSGYQWLPLAVNDRNQYYFSRPSGSRDLLQGVSEDTDKNVGKWFKPFLDSKDPRWMQQLGCMIFFVQAVAWWKKGASAYFRSAIYVHRNREAISRIRDKHSFHIRETPSRKFSGGYGREDSAM